MDIQIPVRQEIFECFESGPNGSCVDSDNNTADFHKNIDIITPQSRSAGAIFSVDPASANQTAAAAS